MDNIVVEVVIKEEVKVEGLVEDVEKLFAITTAN